MVRYSNPAVPLFVEYRPIFDRCSRSGSTSNKERDCTAIDFVRSHNLGTFKQNISSIGSQLQVIRTSFLVNVLSSDLSILIVVKIQKTGWLSRHYGRH